MTEYSCRDSSGEEVTYAADSAREAAQEYVDDGDWGEDTKTSFIKIWTVELDEDGEEIEDTDESFLIELEPDEPACEGSDGHEWRTPKWLGGLEENPGVFAHGGGCKGREVCCHCGIYRAWDSWAQDPATGQQGLNSVEFLEADEESLGWVDQLKEGEDNEA